MLILLSVLFPILSGIILYFRNKDTANTEIKKAPYIVCVLITDALALAGAFAGGSITIFSMSERFSFTFTPDKISLWFLIAVLAVYTFVLIYAFVYMQKEEHVASFFSFYFISLGALIAICMAANLITIYFAFEVTTLSTVPLVLHERTKESFAAGMKYLFYSIGGALLGLLGVFCLYHYSMEGSITFTLGGVLDLSRTAGHEPLLYLAFFLAIVGYGTKAGMFPMHGWLPTAHPLAPAPASALLSGIIAKTGILVIIRFVFYSIGPDFLRGTWVQTAWIILCLITIFMGSMMAFREQNLKKRLAYSTVSQLSYALLGLALLTQEGLNGSLLQVMQHASAKTCLFLCAGAFIWKYGKHRVDELHGIGKSMPVVLWCLTFAGMSLVGIPPMGGLISKWFLVQGSLDAAPGIFAILAPVVLLVSALLTAGYLFPIMINGFFPGKDKKTEFDPAGNTSGIREAAPRAMWIPMICLLVISLVIGLFGSSLISLFGGIV
ncbi:MAG: proton-conducting membrane transporter [Eubacterium sp.]|nr:proton-conducting membrane transporter [Eubacterium sp.]